MSGRAVSASSTPEVLTDYKYVVLKYVTSGYVLRYQIVNQCCCAQRAMACTSPARIWRTQSTMPPWNSPQLGMLSAGSLLQFLLAPYNSVGSCLLKVVSLPEAGCSLDDTCAGAAKNSPVAYKHFGYNGGKRQKCRGGMPLFGL